jgi:group I intron endonuclease
MRIGIIYRITCGANKKIYVGFTTHSAEYRLNKHITEARNGGSRILCKAIRKYGPKAFTTEELCSIIDRDENVAFVEDYFIESLKSLHPHGYNMVHSDYTYERREFISASMTEEWKLNPARQSERQRMREMALTPENLIARHEGLQKYKNTEAGAQQLSDHIRALWSSGKISRVAHRKRLNERWARPGEREKQSKVGKEANLDRQKPLVAVDVNSGAVTHYDCVQSVIKSGVASASSIYGSLHGGKKGQGFYWFYRDSEDDAVYQSLALQNGGRFKFEFIHPISVEDESGRGRDYANVYEMEKDGFKIKEVLRTIRENRASCRGFKIWFSDLVFDKSYRNK